MGTKIFCSRIINVNCRSVRMSRPLLCHKSCFPFAKCCPFVIIEFHTKDFNFVQTWLMLSSNYLTYRNNYATSQQSPQIIEERNSNALIQGCKIFFGQKINPRNSLHISTLPNKFPYIIAKRSKLRARSNFQDFRKRVIKVPTYSNFQNFLKKV